MTDLPTIPGGYGLIMAGRKPYVVETKPDIWQPGADGGLTISPASGPSPMTRRKGVNDGQI